MHLSFQGLGDDGRPCTASVSDVKMSFDVMKAVDERIEECDGLDVRREKAGLLKKVSSALEKCGDIPSLVRTLKPQGVDLVIYRDKDGIPRGSTLIDHTSACVFKGSELSRSVGTAILELPESGPTHDGETNDRTKSSGAAEAESFNSGVSEALSVLLDAVLSVECGSTGRDPDESDNKRKRRNKRRMI